MPDTFVLWQSPIQQPVWLIVTVYMETGGSIHSRKFT